VLEANVRERTNGLYSYNSAHTHELSNYHTFLRATGSHHHQTRCIISKDVKYTRGYHGTEHGVQDDGAELVEEWSDGHEVSSVDDDRWKDDDEERSGVELVVLVAAVTEVEYYTEADTNQYQDATFRKKLRQLLVLVESFDQITNRWATNRGRHQFTHHAIDRSSYISQTIY